VEGGEKAEGETQTEGESMRSKIKGYKRSKIDCRLMCGELRMRADNELDAVVLAAIAGMMHYERSKQFDAALKSRMNDMLAELRKSQLAGKSQKR
jgi:hypothetical protein